MSFPKKRLQWSGTRATACQTADEPPESECCGADELTTLLPECFCHPTEALHVRIILDLTKNVNSANLRHTWIAVIACSRLRKAVNSGRYYLVILDFVGETCTHSMHPSNIRPISAAYGATILPAVFPYSRPAALAKLDGRTKEGRLVRDTRAAMTAHIGGAPSATQRALIERAVQLTLRIATMDRKFAQTGEQTELDSRTYLAWSASLSRVLRDLGMKSVAERPRTLADIHADRARKSAA